MKTVLSPSEIPHTWAHQLQDNARTSNSSLYFEGRTIYSYGRHFPIAVIDANQPQIVYFTTRSYSNTTTKHLYATRSAISHKTLIYCENPDQADRGTHSQNLEAFDNACKSIAKNSLRTARKPEMYLNQIAHQRDLFTRYCTHFKIKKSVQNKYKYIWIESQDGGIKATEKEIKAREKQLKEQIKREKLRHTEDVRKFRAFEVKRVWTRIDRDFLRYNSETKRIETSQEIEIPVKIAQKFYEWVKLIKSTGGCKGECNMKILDFEVQYVNADEIKIGCHVITTAEYETLATQLGW